jgi:hypothetical protein
MAHIENGVLISEPIHTATAVDEFNNGRLDANLFPGYSAKEAKRIEAMEGSPSFAERHWLRGVRAVIPATEEG